MSTATTKTAKTATTKTVAGKRAPAATLMAKRKRVTFGQSFINGVLGGVHRDVAKMALLGQELGAGSKDELAKLEITVLRERVGEAILAANELPRSAAY